MIESDCYFSNHNLLRIIMTTKIKKLNFNDHKEIKIKPGPHLQTIKAANNVNIIVHEFSTAACEMPIIFIKDEDTGRFRSVAVTGLELNENVFFKDNFWQAHFIPGAVAFNPFSLQRFESSDNAVSLELCIDEESEAVNANEGEALYLDDGSESTYTSDLRKRMHEYIHFQRVTEKFLEYLVDTELLVQRSLDVEVSGKTLSLYGMYVVDPKKLENLTDDEFIVLRKRGYLPLIYAHHTSLGQFNHLSKLKIMAAN